MRPPSSMTGNLTGAFGPGETGRGARRLDIGCSVLAGDCRRPELDRDLARLLDARVSRVGTGGPLPAAQAEADPPFLAESAMFFAIRLDASLAKFPQQYEDGTIFTSTFSFQRKRNDLVYGHLNFRMYHTIARA
jgi:hypothetical protein